MDEQKLNLNKKKSFLLGILLTFFILYFPFKKSDEKNFEEFALKKGAAAEFVKFDNLNIHCGHIDDLDKCLNDYQKFGKNLPVVLWIGNSQLHVINQFTNGEETASKKLHKSLIKQGYYLLTFSQPNSNLQEQLLITIYLSNKLPIKHIILPIVFDDMRETKIRPDVETIFEDTISKKILIEKTKTGNKLFNNYLNLTDNKTEKFLNLISLQENSEKLLNDNLESIWSLWERRGELRSSIFTNLYLFRNYIFQINPTSIRQMIPGNYLKNLEALKDLINISKINKMKIFIYTAPIRNDLKIPYEINEYTDFKNNLKNLSKEFDVKYKNFENIIPNSLWGKKISGEFGKEDEVDFMHFRAEGHDLLANIIFNEFNNLID